jgi:hypothetical protein
VRVIVATHPEAATPAPHGVTRDGVVAELFWTTLPPHAFTPADVLDLYLHRGSFETVLSNEDQEQDPDRWYSQTPCGQEFCQILSQWMWNLRLEFGQQLSPTPMRLTEFAPAQAVAPPQAAQSVQGEEPVSNGPPQWARQSYTKGFAGADFSLQPDGTLRWKARHPLYAQERRAERQGSVRVLYAARIGHCRSCPLREHCQASGTGTIKPRRVSAFFWPVACFGGGSTWITGASCLSISLPCALGRLGTLTDPASMAHPASYTDRHRDTRRSAGKGHGGNGVQSP